MVVVVVVAEQLLSVVDSMLPRDTSHVKTAFTGCFNVTCVDSCLR